MFKKNLAAITKVWSLVNIKLSAEITDYHTLMKITQYLSDWPDYLIYPIPFISIFKAPSKIYNKTLFKQWSKFVTQSKSLQ